MTKIKKVTARQILDSRGTPTVEAEVLLENDILARAAVPSGASTGEYEALELRDGDKNNFLGKGVLQACNNIEDSIQPLLTGMDAEQQDKLDKLMVEADGTENKSKFGANAILAVSLALARAGAAASNEPLYAYLARTYDFNHENYTLPVPMMNVLNGGRHAENSTDLQEFMIVPFGADSFSKALQMGVEIFQSLKKIVSKNKFPTTVGDEGGFALNNVDSNKIALDYLLQAIEASGYKAGKEVGIAIDAAASEFFHGGVYDMQKEGKVFSTEELIALYEQWIENYPIVSLEDGLEQNAWDYWPVLEEKIGHRVMNIGDDFLVTNTKRLQKAIENKAANAILIKLNQIGTLTETVEAIKMAQKSGWKAIVSHRSGETCDTFIADLVVATGTGWIKTGSVCRSERVEKYNQILRIEEQLGKMGKFGLE